MATKYQIIAVNATACIKVGDPHDFKSIAEMHAEELRDMLRLVPSGSEITLTVEPISAP